MEAFIDIIKQLLLNAGGTVTAGAVVFALLQAVQISKIKINPWTALRKWIGRLFTKEHIERIDKLEKSIEHLTDLIQNHVADSNRRDAERGRRRILAFEREIQWDVKHSKEEFEDVLETISQYEAYCAAHPDYKNHVAEEATKHIQEVYRDRLRKHDFLNGGK